MEIHVFVFKVVIRKKVCKCKISEDDTKLHINPCTAGHTNKAYFLFLEKCLFSKPNKNSFI